MAGPVYSIAGTFSSTSGGRTRATFQRASCIATASSPVTLLTFNFRTHYPDIVQVWRQRTSAGRHVHHLNMFEHFAGESIYARSVGLLKYEPPTGVKSRYLEDKNAWVLGKGPERKMAWLHPDGSLAQIRHYRDGHKALRVDVDSRQRPVRRLHFEPGRPEEAGLIEYLTHDGRVYLETRRARGAESSHLIRRRDGSEEPIDSTTHLRSRFIADLTQRHPDAVFIIDDRTADQYVIDNPWADDIPSIAAIHSSHREGFEGWMRNEEALARSDRYSAMVVLTREQAADAVEDTLMVDPPHVIAHAAPERRRRWRPRSVDVAVVTRLVHGKQVDHIIEAFAQVVALLPEARLSIWGTGELEQQLRDLTTDLCLDEAVTFEGYTDDPLAAVGSGRLSVSASRSEGFGLSMSEALSQGTPVVSYRYEYGPADLIDHGVNGLIVDQNEPNALAAAIIDLLGDPTRLRRMSRAAAKSMRPYRAAQLRAAWRTLIDQVRASVRS